MCAFAFPFWQVTSFTLNACTFGDPSLRAGYGLPGFGSPYWGSLIAGILFLSAAGFAALTKRSL